MLSETQLKNKVIRYLKSLPDVWFYKANDTFTSGIPDLIICQDGKFTALELKSSTGKTTRLQEYTISKIKASGGEACVCHSLQEVKNVIERR